MRNFIAAVALLSAAQVQAGPYSGAAGTVGAGALHVDDPAFRAWATDYQDYLPGKPPPDVMWRDPSLALGKAVGTSFDIVSLGDGGQLTLTFASPIGDGPGPDFAVFENSFDDTYLELAWVEVSSDNATWHRFANHSLTAAPVETYGSIDPTNITGYAGKHRQGWGTSFDLADLGLSQVNYVRLVDIVGDGNSYDSFGSKIYDPYPQTEGGVGFDLDAVGVINAAVPEPASLGILSVGPLVLLLRKR